MHNGSDLSSGRDLSSARAQMLDLLRGRVRDERVIAAMAAVPRERFVPREYAAHAYADRALPLGHGQTISQPLVVAMMLEALELKSDDRVLEVGAGSGYVAALLSRLARDVVAIERLPVLVERAREAIATLDCANVRIAVAGEALGYETEAPYDAIVVSAGAPHVPRGLLDQLADGGRLVAPVGELKQQHLVRATKRAHGVDLQRLGPCAFVPLIGEEAWRETPA